MLHLPRLRRIDLAGFYRHSFSLPPRAFLPVGMLAHFHFEAIMFKRFSLLLLACALFSGCAAQQTSPNVYRGNEALRTGTVEQVTVMRVRSVTITGNDGFVSTSSGMPGAIGAVVGALLGGSSIGSGNGRYIAGALSGTVSAVVAQVASDRLSRRDGVEVIVRTDSGRQLVVTQDADQHFVSGERLFLVSASNGYRLTR
ncbi:MAG TPA: hypothetical protein VM659_13955 [Dongiaceae bacterium]|nr:hypothetical protein [Dongiaceae bacterium]